jgi:hypothetical protein
MHTERQYKQSVGSVLVLNFNPSNGKLECDPQADKSAHATQQN